MQAKSVLDEVRHARLLADIDHVCQVANVPKMFLHTSMKDHCSATEIDWVVNFRLYRDSKAGLVLDGLDNPDSRSMAICGALLRNFIDARVMLLNTLLQAIKEGNPPDATVLVIPNLYVSTMSTVGNALPAWELQKVFDYLMARFAANRPTVVAVESMAGLQKSYGLSLAQHLKSHYMLAD